MSHLSDCAGHDAVEGIAQVVALDAEVVWLEPEQGTSCSGCAAMSACGAKGIGTLASRLEARRFALGQPVAGPRLRVGERIVVGVPPTALLKGSLTAYALPMAGLLLAGAAAQSAYGRDGLTLLASVAGLALGIGLAYLLARRLSARGELHPRFLRRADSGPVRHSEEITA